MRCQSGAMCDVCLMTESANQSLFFVVVIVVAVAVSTAI